VEERLANYELITSAADLAAVAKTLEEADFVGVDVETTALSPATAGYASYNSPPRTRPS
jgi:hypothetical protein